MAPVEQRVCHHRLMDAFGSYMFKRALVRFRRTD